MSCNGCRVLRKGCSDDCVIRPCLQWISSPEGQANATMFLAKFYGRAGLVNLINAGPEHLRPAIFRSLLYEACGRIINPIYGSVGLYWSGDWSKCQSAVDAVLKGSTNFMQQATLINSGQVFTAQKTYDIRHLPKPAIPPNATTSSFNNLHKVKDAPRLKRSAHKPKLSKPATQWLYQVSSCCESYWSSHDEDRDGSFPSDEEVCKSGHNRVLRFDAPKKSKENHHIVKLDLTLRVGSRASSW